MEAYESLLLALPDGESLTLGRALAHQHALLVDAGLSADEARTLLAREHYFKTWDRAEAAADRAIDRRFEAAADAIATGDLATLARSLAHDPALARARSAYGHRQTLLQHVSA